MNKISSFTFHFNVDNVIVKHSVVLSIFSQFSPGVRDVHVSVGSGVNGVELHDSVRVRLINSLELDGVVVQC